MVSPAEMMDSFAGASVRVEIDVERARADLGETPSLPAAAAWVDRAVQSGRVRIDAAQWGSEAASVFAATLTEAKAKVAAWLAQYLSQPRVEGAASRETRLAVDLRIDRPRPIRSTREGDVATWFTGGRTPLVIERPPASASP